MNGIHALALTVYGEARGESIEGQVAVACVVRNRVQTKFHNIISYTDHCLAPYQFSCWNKNDPNYTKLKDFQKMLEQNTNITDLTFRQCLYLATGVAENYLKDNTSNATHYLVTSLYHSDNCPSWAKSGKVVKTIGSHTFLIST